MAGAELIGQEEIQEVMEVMETGVLMRYEFHDQRKGIYKVAEFEKAFAGYLGSAHALGVTSGSAALKVALTALDVGPGDEVIVPAFDFIATYEAVLEVGAIPVMTDIDDTFNLDPRAIEDRLSLATKAVIPVHMCGAAARMEEILAVTRKHNLLVLEDNAQACGGSIEGKKLGTFGDMGIMSFDFYKTITTGEGGMIVTDSKHLYERSDWYHDHGHDHNPAVGRALEGRTILGFNYRMNELQGALGLAQLRKLDFILAEQRKHKALLKDALGRVPGISFRHLVDPAGDAATFIGFSFSGAPEAKRFQKALAEQRVDATYYKENAWHYAPRWEHLIAGATANSKGYPFTNPIYKGAVDYSADHVPYADNLLGRSLFMAIPVKMSEEYRETVLKGIETAAKAM
ncbi:MAG: DegT/DnrJ/EryC1/StrS family aminotransferase [Syntrophales bacterium]|jgi:8-amino-3,8-dideoxy-alpha-D-manno-octulosonate transaminase|nr:DegT/DnrJ/EryC1/StrS family aminotransferase [Syntrophales bacterium]MCK9527170.1 DegT/DnrJ/EryC1/StrS family aminotransferase [Syntrophales bacterium]MDX9921705.1 DegT/DnrJ/EryC1/StrS family aminotransferase [Syntrophales bacterium]